MPAPNIPQKILRALQPALPDMLATLPRSVPAEPPTLKKSPAHPCAPIAAPEFRKRGLQAHRIPQNHRGAHLRIPTPTKSTRQTSQLLILGHYDTVYASGTIKK